MPRFKVMAGSTQLGGGIEVCIDAADANSAERLVNRMGLIASSVNPVGAQAASAGPGGSDQARAHVDQLQREGLMTEKEAGIIRSRIPAAQSPPSSAATKAARPLDPNDRDFFVHLPSTRETHGPYSASHLEAMNQQGQLPRQAMIGRSGETNWVPLTSFAGGALMGFVMSQLGQSASAAPMPSQSGFSGGAVASAAVYDVDGNGVPDAIAVDVDGDGQVDLFGADTTGDGYVDTVAADVNGDGLVDAVVMDIDGDGIADAVVADTNFDGVADAMAIDVDGDGIIDAVATDMDVEAGGGFLDFLGELF
ncbi:MAG: GYF domain-containing protein [Phycisphaerales bacterium]|nr:GYF domain-containing protein [Phycisphaerales bacterium]